MKAWTPNQIRALRKSLGESREEFAKRCGVSVHLVIAWEQSPTRADGTKNARYREPSGPAKRMLSFIEDSRKG